MAISLIKGSPILLTGYENGAICGYSLYFDDIKHNLAYT
jgi:hypothetical protein